MADLLVLEYTLGDFGTNCYFMVNRETKETIIVDPGFEPNRIQNYVAREGLTPVAIFLTHAHLDHAHGAKTVKAAYNIPVYVHEAEKKTLTDIRMNVSSLFGCPETYEADIFVKDGEILNVAGFEIKVLHTPGHTPGGCCYYFEEGKTLVSGDTLFHQSVGRTDFPGGSMSDLVRAIRDKILTLPRDTEVLPGHMGRTSVGFEAEYNPYL